MGGRLRLRLKDPQGSRTQDQKLFAKAKNRAAGFARASAAGQREVIGEIQTARAVKQKHTAVGADHQALVAERGGGDKGLVAAQ